jgi:soluble lytic murein transglycosylase
MPATGRELSRKVGILKFRVPMLTQPDINLRLGTFYLRQLLDSLNGKWEQTLASYNGGKTRVNRWMGWAEYREPAEFIESIPIQETREYVMSVLRNAAFYRQLYGSQSAAVTSTDEPQVRPVVAKRSPPTALRHAVVRKPQRTSAVPQ